MPPPTRTKQLGSGVTIGGAAYTPNVNSGQVLGLIPGFQA